VTAPWTKERIAELRSLCDEATPGPWEVERRAELRRWTVRSEPTEETVAEIVHWSDMADRADAALIAAARTSLPEALDEIERLRARVDDLETELAGCHDRETEWQTATGLTRGGDPGGVEPRHLLEHIKALSRLEQAARAWRTSQEAVAADILSDAIDALPPVGDS
jgi:hypothetical protein